MLWNNVKQKNYDFNHFLEDRSFLVLYIGFLCRKLYKERTSDTFEMGNIFSLSGYAWPLITKSSGPKCYLSLVTISKKNPIDQRILQSYWMRAFWLFFLLCYLQQKVTFIKTQGHSILGPFCQFWGKEEFFWKLHVCHFFLFLNAYRCAKFLKTTNDPSDHSCDLDEPNSLKKCVARSNLQPEEALWSLKLRKTHKKSI